MNIDPVIAVVLRALLALLFASSAWHKLKELHAFRIVLHDYEVLPHALVTPATGIVVLTEIMLAAAFPWPASASWAARAATALLVVYTVAIAVNLVRGRRTLECGCGPSVFRQPLSEWLLARNVALIGACAAVLLPVSDRGWASPDWVTFAGAVASGAATWTASQRLMASSIPRQRLRGVAR